MTDQTWGIIGFGEAGAAFALHVNHYLGRPVHVMDPLLNTKDPPDHIRSRLEEVPITIMPDIPQLMAQCDVVLSLVTPRVATKVAAQAGAAWQRGLFIDCNSIAPEEKRVTARYFGEQSYVDGAILGSISTGVARLPLALAGPRAAQAHALLSAIQLRTSVVSHEVGSASALKMCRSIFMKGIECLLIETTLTAAQFGITEPVLASVEQTIASFGFQSMVNMLITTHAVHCGRRADEMQHVTSMLEHMGLPHIMSDAARDVLAASDRAGLPAHFEGVLPNDSKDVIAYLTDVYMKGEQP